MSLCDFTWKAGVTSITELELEALCCRNPTFWLPSPCRFTGTPRIHKQILENHSPHASSGILLKPFWKTVIASSMVQKVKLVSVFTSHAAHRRPQHYAGEGYFQDGSKPLVGPLKAEGQVWASTIGRAYVEYKQQNRFGELSEMFAFQQMKHWVSNNPQKFSKHLEKEHWCGLAWKLLTCTHSLFLPANLLLAEKRSIQKRRKVKKQQFRKADQQFALLRQGYEKLNIKLSVSHHANRKCVCSKRNSMKEIASKVAFKDLLCVALFLKSSMQHARTRISFASFLSDLWLWPFKDTIKLWKARDELCKSPE